jgi:AAA domain/Toprim domain/FaeA-like protein
MNETLLGRLDARKSGTGWTARCPAHDDSSPSLSIGQGEDGRILMHCHAGCGIDEVLAAVNLTPADLYPPKEPTASQAKRIVATYDYCDEHGTLLSQVVRFTPKDFAQRRPDGHGGWIRNAKGVRRVLFELPEVIEAVKARRTIYICEGEKDAEALEAAGAVATCNVSGAGNWRPEYADALKGAARVVVVADRDDKGRDHARQVADSLTALVGRLSIVEAAVGKDAADHLGAGRTLDEFVTTWDSEASDKPNDLLAGLHDGTWLDAQIFQPLDYAVERILPEGLALLAGAPKIGKSWLVLQLALGVSYGGTVLSRIYVKQRPVLYLALEDGDRRMQDRCRKLLGEDARIPPLFHYITRVTPGNVIATVEAWLDQLPAGAPPLVILDTLGKVMPPALQGESAYQRDYRIGTDLKNLADTRPGMSLLVNHHDRKAGAEDFVDQVSGTNGLAGAADSILILTRRRLERDGIISVTGRDVTEGEYAVGFEDAHRWTLDGDSWDAAQAAAVLRRASSNVGDRSVDILGYVNKHPEGVSTKDVTDEFGEAARQYLRRLDKAGRIRRSHRGIYCPIVTSDSCDTDTGA